LNVSKIARRFGVAVASVLAIAATLAPAANAAPVSRAVVPHDAIGCDGFVCIQVYGPADGYTAIGYDDELFAIFYGHIELLGPGISRSQANSPDEWAPSWQASGIGRGQVCAIAWLYVSAGQYTEEGTACERVF